MFTKIGTILAAAYLIIVLVVSIPFLFYLVVNGGEGGLHSASGMSFVFVMILTSLMSWPALSAVDNYFPALTESARTVLVAFALAVSALTNAAAIYLISLAAARLFRAFRESRRYDKHAHRARV